MTDPNGQLTTAKIKSKPVADKRRQNEAITLDQALEELSSAQRVTEIDSLLRSIKVIDFHLEQKPNKMFELNIHVVVSAKALLMLSGGLIGVGVVAIKLLAR
jgi:hypothetical protein